MVAGLIYIWVLSRDLPSLEQLENFDPDLVTRIYSSDGVMLKELYTQRRVFVDLEKIPSYLADAAVASEDRRFESHWGISMRDFIAGNSNQYTDPQLPFRIQLHYTAAGPQSL